jgi:hypothetical protein
VWLHPDPDQALGLAVRLCAVAQLIGLAELVLVRAELAPGGFLDWSMIGLLSPKTRTRVGQLIRRWFRRLGPRTFAGLLALAVVTAGGLLVWPAAWPLIAVAAAVQVVLMKRHHITIDGSDQMTLMVLIVCLLGRIGANAITLRAAVSFLAAELTLAYLVAGLSKAASAHWRADGAFATIVRTRMYGHAAAARFLGEHHALGRPAAYAVFCWESLFFVTLTAPPAFVYIALAIGLSFHVGCAIVMGLNRFVWAFTASYPALLCTNLAIRAALGAHTADALAVGAGAVGVLGLAILIRPRRGLPAREHAAAALDGHSRAGSSDRRLPTV